jgi:hypothetical protein
MPYVDVNGQYYEDISNRPDIVGAISVPERPTPFHTWNVSLSIWEIESTTEEELKWREAGKYFTPSQLIRAIEILINSIEALSLSNPLPNSFNNLKTKLEQLKMDVGL